jgi:c-di-GMP-binding flagellar brake protein YcgR
MAVVDTPSTTQGRARWRGRSRARGTRGRGGVNAVAPIIRVQSQAASVRKNSTKESISARPHDATSRNRAMHEMTKVTMHIFHSMHIKHVFTGQIHKRRKNRLPVCVCIL